MVGWEVFSLLKMSQPTLALETMFNEHHGPDTVPWALSCGGQEETENASLFQRLILPSCAFMCQRNQTAVLTMVAS